MVNDDIVGGLKSGLERGEPLQQVMMSFLNAGYNKSEIEEAARSLMSEGNQLQMNKSQEKKPEETMQKSEPKKESKPLPVLGMFRPKPKEQKVSGYGKKKSANKIMIILMIVLAVIFVGVLSLFLLTQ